MKKCGVAYENKNVSSMVRGTQFIFWRAGEFPGGTFFLCLEGAYVLPTVSEGVIFFSHHLHSILDVDKVVTFYSSVLEGCSFIFTVPRGVRFFSWWKS